MQELKIEELNKLTNEELKDLMNKCWAYSVKIEKLFNYRKMLEEEKKGIEGDL